MRGVYFRLFFVILTSATNRYDGSMMNGLQILPQWEKCKVPSSNDNPANKISAFHHPSPSPSHIGLLLCIMFIGSLVAIPFAPYIADGLGQRRDVMVGCVIMFLGVVLQGLDFNFGKLSC
jgi:MFS family permease